MGSMVCAMAKTESRNIKLPDVVWSKLRKMADKDGRTVGNLVRFVLQQYVNGGK